MDSGLFKRRATATRLPTAGTPPARETEPYQDVRFTGEHFASIRDEATVINEAQPVRHIRAATDLAERVVRAVLAR